LNTRIENTHD